MQTLPMTVLPTKAVSASRIAINATTESARLVQTSTKEHACHPMTVSQMLDGTQTSHRTKTMNVNVISAGTLMKKPMRVWNVMLIVRGVPIYDRRNVQYVGIMCRISK